VIRRLSNIQRELLVIFDTTPSANKREPEAIATPRMIDSYINTMRTAAAWRSMLDPGLPALIVFDESS